MKLFSAWKIPAAWQEEENRASSLVFLSFLGAFLAIAFNGFNVGSDNNYYHLPIVLGLYDLPQFAEDSYIQSLRHFYSVFWKMFEGALSERSIVPVFAFFHVLTQALTFFGFLLCAGELGVRRFLDRLVFVAMLACGVLMDENSLAGNGGLFRHLFTHSEIANGLTLILIYYAVRGKFVSALALNGAVFLINVFIAAWNCVPLGLLMILALVRKQAPPLRLLRDGLVGAVVFLLLASPVIYWIVSAPGFGQPLAYNYAEFLRFFHPDHFLFSELTTKNRIGLLTVFLLGSCSWFLVAGDRRAWALVFTGYVAVYMAGIVLPHVSTSPLLLNLHLLRSSAFIQIFTALAATSVAVSWMHSRDKTVKGIFLPALILGLVSNIKKISLPLALLAVAGMLSRRVRESVARLPQPAFLPVVAYAVLAVGLCHDLVGNYEKVQQENGQIEALKDAGVWARANTPETSLFLLPDVQPFGEAQAKWASEDTTADFSSFSLRRGWVDFKRGAAAMWMPSYYPEWRARIEETRGLESMAQKKAYSKQNGIDYILTRCREADVEEYPMLYRNRYFCVYSTETRKKTE
jgi:hypothetical protein